VRVLELNFTLDAFPDATPIEEKKDCGMWIPVLGEGSGG